jgi:hypothetical protein
MTLQDELDGIRKDRNRLEGLLQTLDNRIIQLRETTDAEISRLQFESTQLRSQNETLQATFDALLASQQTLSIQNQTPPTGG